MGTDGASNYLEPVEFRSKFVNITATLIVDKYHLVLVYSLEIRLPK